NIGGSQGFMGAILGTGKSETTNKVFGTPGSPGAIDLGGSNGGIFKPILDKMKEDIKGFASAIKEADWKAIGTSIRESIETVITVDNAKRIGQLVRIYIVDPAY